MTNEERKAMCEEVERLDAGATGCSDVLLGYFRVKTLATTLAAELRAMVEENGKLREIVSSAHRDLKAMSDAAYEHGDSEHQGCVSDTQVDEVVRELAAALAGGGRGEENRG